MKTLMLRISEKRRPRIGFVIIVIVSIAIFGAGAYIMVLAATPAIIPYFKPLQIKPEDISSPQIGVNRIIIPKIGVDIPYGLGEVSLDTGAQWRYPERGSPEIGGNFIIAAHRFNLASTPGQTLVKSPFYHIDKLATGDQIIIDYEGKRYGYTVSKIYNVKPTQTEIEAPSENAKLTLYTCSLGGSSDGRVVIEASPLGEVTLESTDLHDG